MRPFPSRDSHAPSIRRALLSEHAYIDSLLSRLEEAAIADVHPDLERTWAELEPMLLSHLADEEAHLFDAARSDHAEDVARLTAEHERIRAMLATLGVGVELHAVRADDIRALIALLRDHANREDESVYAAADRGPSPDRDALRARLRALAPRHSRA